MTDSAGRTNSLPESPLPTPDHAPTFVTVYRSEFSYVWRTLRRLGADPRDLEDLAHDLFIVVFRHLGNYDATRPLRPWLFGIAVRVMADYRRSVRRAHERMETNAEPPPAPAIAEEKLAVTEAREMLMKALDSLDLDRRAVFVMHELDETPIPAIAAALEIPLNTAYSRLRLARADVSAHVRRLRLMEDRLMEDRLV